MSLIGLRVVRGWGWKSGDEDGGIGGVGTVVSEADPDATASVEEKLGAYSQQGDSDRDNFHDAEKRYVVTVVWDCTGLKGTYPVCSPQLQVLDNSCLGFKHPVGCNGPHCSGSTEIVGIRWQCSICSANYCVYCFFQMGEPGPSTGWGPCTHLNHHIFSLYEHPRAEKQRVELNSSKRIPLRGIFVGAKVKKGLNWNFGDEGDGEVLSGVGEVIKPLSNLNPDLVLVRWENGNCFPYRRSKLDLAVVEPKEIGSYQSNLILPALNITSNRHTSDEDCDSSETSTRSLTRRSSRVVFDTRSTYGRSKFRHGYDSDSSASPTNYLGNKKRLVISSILWNQQLKGKQMGYMLGSPLHGSTSSGKFSTHPALVPEERQWKKERLRSLLKESIGQGNIEVLDHVNERKGNKGRIDQRELRKRSTPKLAQVSNGSNVVFEKTGVNAKEGNSEPLAVDKFIKMMYFNYLVLAPQNPLHGCDFSSADEDTGISDGAIALKGAKKRSKSDDQTALDIKTQLNRLIYEHDEGVRKLDNVQPTRSQAFPILICPDNNYSLRTDWSDSLVGAASDGDLALVKRYVGEGTSVNACRAESRVNALHEACRKGHLHIVDWLVKNGADLESSDKKGRSALYFAVKGCQPEILAFLISLDGVKLDRVASPNKKRWSALRKAVEKNCTANCVKILIEGGCNVNIQDWKGQTALHRAIVKTWSVSVDVPNMIVDLVSSGRVNWELKDNSHQKFSAFHLAVHHGNFGMVKYLLKMGGTKLLLQRIDGSNLSALHYVSCCPSNFQLAKLFVDYVKELKRPNLMQLEDEPSTSSISETEDQILSVKNFIDLRTNEEITPLLIACCSGDYAIIELLVEAGADVCAKDCVGNTTIINSTHKWQNNLTFHPPLKETSPNIFEVYIEHIRNELMSAYPCLAIICYLIKKGCTNFKAANNSGKTAIDLLTNDSTTQTKMAEFLENFSTSFPCSSNTSISDVISTGTKESVPDAASDEHHQLEIANDSCRVCHNQPASLMCDVLDQIGQITGSIPICSSCITKANSSNPETAMDISEPLAALVNQGASTSKYAETNNNEEEAALPMNQSEQESSEDSSTSGVSSARSSPRSASSSASSFQASTVTSNRIRTGAIVIIQPTWWEIIQEKDKDVLTDDQGGRFIRSNNGQWNQCSKQGAKAGRKCPASVVEENGMFTLSRSHVHCSFKRKRSKSSSNPVIGYQA